MAYDVSHLLPVPELAPGTTLLISGPPLTRKRELLLRLLRPVDAEGTAMVTTKMGAGTLLERYRDLTDGATEADLKVIDCVTQERGLGDVRDTETTRYVSSPRDLTGLSISLTGVFKQFRQQSFDARIGIHSLSTFLMYEDLQRVYRMIHVLGGQIESLGWLGAFVVDSPTDRERGLLSQLVDGIVETRETDSGCEFRLRGLGGRAAGWQAY